MGFGKIVVDDSLPHSQWLLTLTQSPGTASSSFALANDPALIGVPFFQQTIPFEFDLAGAVTAVRGSNALSLVIGTF